jgi:MFS transporter, GlpU family, inner membrane protein
MPERLAGGESGALLRHVIWLFTTVTALAAALVWWAVPYTPPSATGNEGFRLGECRRVLALPQVWLQALVVICAYVAYKGLDDVSLYAREIMGMSEVDAARMATVALWMRPPAAVVAGLVADRWSAITSTRVCFALVALGSFGIASGLIDSAMVPLFYLVILGTCVAVFALRALYFAIMEEGQVPLRYTGTAVGIVSAIGYLPDVFMGPAMGWLLDHHPGMAGHSRVFLLIGIFSLLGWAASLGFALCVRQNHGITAV